MNTTDTAALRAKHVEYSENAESGNHQLTIGYCGMPGYSMGTPIDDEQLVSLLSSDNHNGNSMNTEVNQKTPHLQLSLYNINENNLKWFERIGEKLQVHNTSVFPKSVFPMIFHIYLSPSLVS